MADQADKKEQKSGKDIELIISNCKDAITFEFGFMFVFVLFNLCLLWAQLYPETFAEDPNKPKVNPEDLNDLLF